MLTRDKRDWWWCIHFRPVDAYKGDAYQEACIVLMLTFYVDQMPLLNHRRIHMAGLWTNGTFFSRISPIVIFTPGNCWQIPHIVNNPAVWVLLWWWAAMIISPPLSPPQRRSHRVGGRGGGMPPPPPPPRICPPKKVHYIKVHKISIFGPIYDVVQPRKSLLSAGPPE